jgi:hypothetical protein
MVKFKKMKKVGRKIQMGMIAGLLVAAAIPFIGNTNVPGYGELMIVH